MKYKVIGISAVLGMLVLVLVLVAFSSGPEKLFRYHQHEQSRSVEELSSDEQTAAMSLSTDPNSFASHLPVVSIQTDGQEIPGRAMRDENGERIFDDEGKTVTTTTENGESSIPVTVELFNNEVDEPDTANRLTDVPEFETQAEMHIRGTSSSFFDKPSYRLEFTLEDRVTSNPQEVLGMGVEEDWVLHGPYLDKTLMHNYFSFNIFGEILPYTPDVRFVELFLDNQYQGLYVLMESIKVGKDRVDIKKSDNNDIDTGYLALRDWNYSFGNEQLTEYIQETDFVSEVGIAIRYPTLANITPEQREWIQDDLNRLEKQLYSFDYDEPQLGYWSTLNTDSFVDYALVNEFSMNNDATSGSTFYYKDYGDKLAIGPIWDFNSGYGYMFTPQRFEGISFFYRRPSVLSDAL